MPPPAPWDTQCLQPPLSIVVLAAALACAGCGDRVRPGDVAPGFLLPGPGGAITLESFRGHVLVLNFWASWCQPCAQETPDLNALQADFPDRKVEILGVSVDTNPAAYASFLAGYRVDFLTALDPSADVPTRYGTKGWPETYIIDPGGTVRRKLIGPADWTSADMIAYLRDLARGG